jgi:hypothetical protein
MGVAGGRGLCMLRGGLGGGRGGGRISLLLVVWKASSVVFREIDGRRQRNRDGDNKVGGC